MDLPDPELPAELVERHRRASELSEAMWDLCEELDKHPELGRRFTMMVDALNAWLKVSAIARD